MNTALREPSVSPTERMLHEASCGRLSLAFAAHVDAREFHQASALFCDDAVWDHVAGSYRGPIEIGAALASLPADICTRHFVTNIAIDLVNEKQARGRSYVMLLQGVVQSGGLPVCEAAPVIAENEDEYSQVDGRWKIFRRATKLVFKA